MPARELAAHPANWRRHPESQINAVRGMLQRIGWADACIAREMPGGGYQLIDGHLRAGLDPDQLVPVLVVDLTDAEAMEVLATLDPLAAMAEADDELLRTLVQSFEDSELADILDQVEKAEAIPILNPEAVPPPLSQPDPGGTRKNNNLKGIMDREPVRLVLWDRDRYRLPEDLIDYLEGQVEAGVSIGDALVSIGRLLREHEQ